MATIKSISEAQKLHGTPITTNFSWYVSYSSCNPSYWPVNPHSEAVLTIRIFFPLKVEKSISEPSSALTLKE